MNNDKFKVPVEFIDVSRVPYGFYDPMDGWKWKEYPSNQQYQGVLTRYGTNKKIEQNWNDDTTEQLEEKLKKIIGYKARKSNKKLQRIMDFFIDKDNLSSEEEIGNLLVEEISIEVMDDVEKSIRKELQDRKNLSNTISDILAEKLE